MLKPKKTKRATGNKSFDELFSNLLLRLLTVNPRDVDTEIHRSIAEIGEHYHIDRVDFRKISENRSMTALLHWWVRSGDTSLFANLPNDKIPWAAGLILRGEVIQFRRLDDMPAEAAAERKMLERDGLSAVVLVPLIVDEQIWGSLLLASNKERAWSDNVVRDSRLLGDAMAVAYARAQRHNALRASEGRLRAVLENQEEFIVRWLPDGTTTWVNDKYCEHVQQSRESIIGSSLPPQRESAGRQKVMDVIESLTVDHPTRTVEQQVLLPSGEAGWLSWTDTGIFDSTGKLIEIQSVGRDLTILRLARENIETSESKFRTLFEFANDSIFLLDAEKIIDCNIKALEVFQRKREDLIGMAPWDISVDNQPDGSTSEELAREIIEAVYAGETRRFEWVHTRADGTPINMDISLTTIELTDTGPRLLAVARDITETKRAQREIEHRAKFQSLLAELSTSLSTAAAEETGERVDQAFERVGIDYGLDRMSLRWISGENGDMERRAAWQRVPDDNPLSLRVLSSAYMPWTTTIVINGGTVKIDNVDTMPDEAKVDQSFLRKRGLRSLLGFPIRVRGTISGIFSIGTISQKTWDENTVRELRLIADAISGACIRHWATEALMRSERDLLRSQEVAGVGSYSFVPDGSDTDFPPTGKLELSSQFRKLYGLDDGPTSLEQVVARVHPDDTELVLSSIRNAIDTGNRAVETYRVVRPDKTVVYLENKPYNVTGGSKHTDRIFGTVQDVTERVESRNEIEEAFDEISKLKDQLQQENVYLRQEIRAAHGFDKIIGNSPNFRAALNLAATVAPTDVSVLILGETGAGKELVAQAIHDISNRKNNAMISVNCAAFSSDLVESELFGHEKGAFTGANSQRKGRFELADGGTLFLDEIGELREEHQAKLLRVLQTGVFERLGGSHTLHADVRLIAATNKNLKRAVDKGEFRADLYYRISSFPIEIPPLRERPEDIPALAEFLVRKHAKRIGKNIQSISARTLRYATNQQWPGNVRELEGFIQRALISATGPVLDYSEAHSSYTESSTSIESDSADASADLRSAERRHILKVLKKCRWVIDGNHGAASMMGVAPSTLRSKMRRLEIERPA